MQGHVLIRGSSCYASSGALIPGGQRRAGAAWSPCRCPPSTPSWERRLLTEMKFGATPAGVSGPAGWEKVFTAKPTSRTSRPTECIACSRLWIPPGAT